VYRPGQDFEINVIFTPSQQQDRSEVRRDDVVCQIVSETPGEQDAVGPKDPKDKIETKQSLLHSPTTLRLKASFTGTSLQQKPG
jgi:hypothetical protein